MTTVCPHCGRKLLSHASALCNWCGAAIDDAAYQAEAQRERVAFFQHQAQHDAQSLANAALITLPVPLSSQPVLPQFGRALAETEPADAPPSSAPDTPDDDTQARFTHLEV